MEAVQCGPTAMWLSRFCGSRARSSHTYIYIYICMYIYVGISLVELSEENCITLEDCVSPSSVSGRMRLKDSVMSGFVCRPLAPTIGRCRTPPFLRVLRWAFVIDSGGVYSKGPIGKPLEIPGKHLEIPGALHASHVCPQWQHQASHSQGHWMLGHKTWDSHRLRTQLQREIGPKKGGPCKLRLLKAEGIISKSAHADGNKTGDARLRLWTRSRTSRCSQQS